MPVLRIRGWETGFKKLRMTDILVETLMLEKKESEELVKAVSAGQVISLEVEDGDVANDLHEKLLEVGALVEMV